MSSIVKVDTIQENTSANGITVDGLNIKDSKLVTANSVVAANITNGVISADKLVSGVLPTNTPAFEAVAAGTQTGIGSNVATKMNMGSEIYDTNGRYDADVYTRFTPGVAGKYFVYGQIYMESSSGSHTGKRALAHIYKNGSSFKQTIAEYAGETGDLTAVTGLVSTVMDLDDNDYVELFGQFLTFSGDVELDGRVGGGHFGAYKIIT